MKLYYSEVLQRMTDFGAEVAGLAAHTVVEKPRSSGWESGAWVLDFIGSWEWTIPGGTSEIQRTIIGERGLGLPARVGSAAANDADFAELHASYGGGPARAGHGRRRGASTGGVAESGWLGLEVAEDLGGAGATFAEVA